MVSSKHEKSSTFLVSTDKAQVRFAGRLAQRSAAATQPPDGPKRGVGLPDASG